MAAAGNSDNRFQDATAAMAEAGLAWARAADTVKAFGSLPSDVDSLRTRQQVSWSGVMNLCRDMRAGIGESFVMMGTKLATAFADVVPTAADRRNSQAVGRGLGAGGGAPRGGMMTRENNNLGNGPRHRSS